VIATLRRDGETLAVHVAAGSQAGSVRALAAYCDRERWKIVCLSTPITIYRDLQGTRRGLDEHATTHERAIPEHTMLGEIGRLDLLDER
jgi:hypothetical protein